MVLLIPGTSYGSGVYFALNAHYSCQYAKPDYDDTGYMFGQSRPRGGPVYRQGQGGPSGQGGLYAHDEKRYIYLARVLTGFYTKGDSYMRVPPPRHPKDPSVLFDSVVDQVRGPSIFVVFHDGQAYPEYLITF